MSHFSVCVAIPGIRLIGKEIGRCEIEEILDDILAPYDEGTEDRRYMAFDDRTGEAGERYENGSTAAVRFPDGTVRSQYDSVFTERFKVSGGKILEKTGGDAAETEDSLSLELIADCPLKKLYTFEEYCRVHCSYSEHQGRWGYWYNPDARWDWYAVGGRYSGAFLADRELRQCLETGDGEDRDFKFKHADGARKGDIAWAEKRRRAAEAGAAEYDLLRRCFETGDVRELGTLAAVTEDGIRGWCETLYRKGESLNEYLLRSGIGPNDRFVLNCYSFVDQYGEWHSMGDMGWFGISANEKGQREWHSEVQDFLTALDDDDFLVMVDCHI